MVPVRRRILLGALKLFDVGLMILAFGVAAYATSRFGPFTFEQIFAMRFTIQNFVLFLALVCLWHVVFGLFGLYASRRLSNRWDETLNIFYSTSTASLVLFLISWALHIRLVTSLFLIVFWLASLGFTATARVGMRLFLRYVRLHGRNLRDVLVVGTNARAVSFARKLQQNPALGYSILGFVDDEWSGLNGFRESGFPLACDYSGLAEYLRTHVVDEVMVVLPVRSFHQHISEIVALCEKQGILLRLMSNVFDLKLASARTEEIEGDSLVTHYTGSMNEGWPLAVKRAADCVVSFVALVLVSPLLLVVAALVKLTSPGPIIFVQKRLGVNKRRFNIYKFRTMVVDAEKRMKEVEHLNEVNGPAFKIKNDPRITPIGSFLRKTSIDELPQLFNVLKGDMSLVGPRPLPVRDYNGFSEDWQRRRFSVRPGVTCLWQVGGRSSLSFDKWMELDLEYIDRWSLWLDFQILAKTIPAVLRGSGAA